MAHPTVLTFCPRTQCGHPTTQHSRLSGCLAAECECTLPPAEVDRLAVRQANPLRPEPVAVPTYAGTSGHSGSEASRDAVIDQDIDGSAAAGRERTLRLLGNALQGGLTWRELASVTGWHHGRATSFLSHLHKQGHVARLLERRENCSVYVLPDQVNGRTTARHGRVGTPLARLTPEEREGYDQARNYLAASLGFPGSNAVVLTQSEARALLDTIERLS